MAELIADIVTEILLSRRYWWVGLLFLVVVALVIFCCYHRAAAADECLWDAQDGVISYPESWRVRTFPSHVIPVIKREYSIDRQFLLC
ncbi:MAG: hypothetical protein IKJ29_07325 [Akkermansia sp.]|nr:hypothetical protein [Akkermansia sp.]